MFPSRVVEICTGVPLPLGRSEVSPVVVVVGAPLVVLQVVQVVGCSDSGVDWQRSCKSALKYLSHQA